MASAVIRIRRKRTADPHSAVLLSFKRSRTEAGGGSRELYRLAGTASEAEVRCEIEKLARNSQVSSIAVAELDAEKLTVSDVQSMEVGELPQAADGMDKSDETAGTHDIDDANPLASFADAVGEISGPLPTPTDNPQSSSITCNGTPLLRVKSTVAADDDFVYDLYVKNKSKVAEVAPIASDYFADLIDVRFMNAEQELVFVDEDAEEESIPDDEDSNAEDDWRNDYPDEDDEDSDRSASDEDDDVLVQRFRGIGFHGDGCFQEFDEDSDCD